MDIVEICNGYNEWNFVMVTLYIEFKNILMEFG